MTDRAQKIAEAHVIKLHQIELASKADIDAAYDALRSKVTVERIAGFFDAINAAAREIMGKRGQEALDESVRYSERLMGGKVNRPSMADLGDTIEDYIDEFEEHTRHVQALVAIRSRRMVRKGVGAETITAVLLEDFERGGEMFSFLRNSLKRSIGSAVQLIGKEAEFAALRPKGKRDAKQTA
ncbi:MAG: hypothetical protein ACPGWS_01760 [Solirubrobacterales bacterium]